MSCRCLDEMREELAAYNVRVVAQPTPAVPMPQPRVVIQTARIDPLRKGLPVLTASYCPFCGRPYQDLEAAAAATEVAA